MLMSDFVVGKKKKKEQNKVTAKLLVKDLLLDYGDKTFHLH